MPIVFHGLNDHIFLLGAMWNKGSKMCVGEAGIAKTNYDGGVVLLSIEEALPFLRKSCYSLSWL